MWFDRHQVNAFVRFVLRRFLDERCFLSAGALALTTLFAVVPLVTVVFGVLSAFPVFAQWRQDVSAFVFRNFVPAAGEAVQDYLIQFADNASKATAVGIVVLLVSVIALTLSVEDAFNRIWRVPQARRAGSRFIVHWTVITLGPMAVVALLALSAYLFALPLFAQAEAEFSLKARLLRLLPFLIQWLVLVAAYALIPNRSVRVRDAALGATFAALLFELLKHLFTDYATNGANYQEVYGALAMVPIFVFWIYLSWILVLMGASLTASLAAFDYRPQELQLAPGNELRGLVRVLAHFVAAQRDGCALHSQDLRALEPFLSDDLVQRYLSDLSNAGLIRRGEDAAWALTCDLSTTTLYDVYAHCEYRLPSGAGFPGGVDAVAERLLDEANAAVRDRLRVRLNEIFPPAARSNTATDTGPEPSEEKS
jgi:membrane protein